MCFLLHVQASAYPASEAQSPLVHVRYQAARMQATADRQWVTVCLCAPMPTYAHAYRQAQIEVNTQALLAKQPRILSAGGQTA